MTRFDADKNGHISREDFELMAKKLAEYGKMSKEQAESAREAFVKVADEFGLKPGVKIPLEEAALKASKLLLARTPEQQKTDLYPTNNKLFDVLDTNKDDYISKEEFKVYFQVIGPEISQAEVSRSFNTIDSNGDGKISREEFLAAAHDFVHGLEETEVSNTFFGHLLP